MKIAVCPGSFDPVTYGHLDIFKRASKLFDEVVVLVMVNVDKNPSFTAEERMEMIEEATAHLDNVSTDMCTGLLADFVNNNQFNVVVRGLRNVSDFDNEQSMAQLHQHLYNDKTETVFLISDAKYAFISSTMAKQVIGLGGRGDHLVPPCVLEKMKGRLNK